MCECERKGDQQERDHPGKSWPNHYNPASGFWVEGRRFVGRFCFVAAAAAFCSVGGRFPLVARTTRKRFSFDYNLWVAKVFKIAFAHKLCKITLGKRINLEGKKNTGKREKEESVLSQAGEQKSYKRVRTPPDEGRLTSIAVRVKWVEANTFLYKIKACTHTHTHSGTYSIQWLPFSFLLLLFFAAGNMSNFAQRNQPKKEGTFCKKIRSSSFSNHSRPGGFVFSCEPLVRQPLFLPIFHTHSHTRTARQSTHWLRLTMVCAEDGFARSAARRKNDKWGWKS